ncbi:NADH-ubiquinone oxidoreductase chain L [Pseudonocardia sp. Ae406_Ps2]|uniref:NADH-quinone oxidoreductase subunit L n=1 Tax=unclassified Pseudonocardia TaxID=2619320 RepID=UPI00094B6556|nr:MULTISPECIES: NADH-quinone oxidoreductase subunit L [unclassified Pseudonocardia]OLL97755.1 NADH-ubiquinone oxidoreductase chain L [Pseudonocardia sp. Ae331_Ps2]OLM04530.1 NADH-ubiquinone oxidoreductase chain L [Pseudonocardia sp. Ae406_Ps2]OLM10636.1 NADH-ubiquinone oxidoreductase chain L [Pseudonocardia sp. Ae505_Ps2]OLM26100.1 NADH-ubiquinone oxidoreductase chain L [Pseudonocardia sp. Ae706_Ps2]OLM33785.1 NADH-ubiquinone oxidoreductase chain L [Pseudonocardia sp. Ae717_Ps2]
MTVLLAQAAPQATGAASLAWLLIALPAAGALVLFLAGRRADAWGHWLGVATVVGAFVVGVTIFLQTLGLPADERLREQSLWSWMSSGALEVDFGLRIDTLSLTFVLLITGVGALIHLYSVGYMSHDPNRRRFFAQLNLFVAAMLVLVLGNNFVMLYLGWEGVGLASYLLIGFYQDRPSAATAAKKAFLMNRVGDVGLAIAIFLLWLELGTLQYTEVFARIGEVGGGTVLAITLLLLLGACGKSGQFPLQSWLPDAMEGPTPVSALIHAATMVTAGVYLIARASPIYNLSETGRLVVALIGVVTLMIGAIIGCAYDDIKKVLAYSTVSQIGYMILAVGLGPAGYALGILHLLTHGFFKAGLFLGAGSVMHAMNDDVDMRRFGGLWRKMPVTFVTFGLGYLALIGFPFLSGYFSKDAIIEAAFAQEGWQGWVFGGLATLAAGLTAFYMTRLMIMTFFGAERWRTVRSTDGRDYHPHESPATMTVPMIVLAVGSVFGGGVLYGLIPEWLAPVVGERVELEGGALPHAVIPWLVVGVSLLGVLAGYLFVGRSPVPVQRPQRVSPVVAAARADLGANAFNEAFIERPGIALTRLLAWFDDRGIDGAVNGTASAFGGGSGRLRRLQTGFVRSYALSMLGGAVIVVAAMLAVRFVS